VPRPEIVKIAGLAAADNSDRFALEKVALGVQLSNRDENE
jgi:hypothetical protein